MLILEAAAAGLCFGVRDALRALDAIASPNDVTIHGELVHNGEVLRELDRRGFRQSPEADRPVPDTPAVLVTAHGISDAERARLAAAGKTLIDTTCPLVQKAHDAAQQLQREGRTVVVIGRAGHVEVRGLVEDLAGAIVVGTPAEVSDFGAARLGVVCQTTTPLAHAEQVVEAIRARNPAADVRVIDTICSPTKARIDALAELLPRIDALVVVGGRDSNNTRQLALTAQRAGVPALHVETAADLDPAWFLGRRVVGLTAGTSTLDGTLAAVRERLRTIAPPDRLPAAG